MELEDHRGGYDGPGQIRNAFTEEVISELGFVR